MKYFNRPAVAIVLATFSALAFAMTDVENLPPPTSISGIGLGAVLTFSPATLDLGADNVGGMTYRGDVFVRNTGNAIARINSITTTGDFTAATTCVGNLVFPNFIFGGARL